MQTSTYNDIEINKLQPSAEARQAISQFIADFDSWVFGDFRRALSAADRGVPDAAELSVSLDRWIAKLSGLDTQEMITAISPPEAAKLGCLLNYALDGLSKHYVQSGSSPSVMMLVLSPVDDLLVFLSLAQKKATSHTHLNSSETD